MEMVGTSSAALSIEYLHFPSVSTYSIDKKRKKKLRVIIKIESPPSLYLLLPILCQRVDLWWENFQRNWNVAALLLLVVERQQERQKWPQVAD